MVGVGSFKASAPLEFAEERAREVGDALGVGANLVLNPEFAKLKDALRGALGDTGEGGALVVHALSHGFRGTPGALWVAAADSHGVENGVHVESWLQRIEDADGSPAVLLLLDVCHAGVPVDQQWRVRLPTDRRKTWIIGATTADWQAFQGRFSQAVASVLRDLRVGHPPVDGVGAA